MNTFRYKTAKFLGFLLLAFAIAFIHPITSGIDVVALLTVASGYYLLYDTLYLRYKEKHNGKSR